MSRLRVLQVPVVLAIFGVLLWRTGVGDVRDALGDIDPWLALAVVALNAPLCVLFALRSHLVLDRLGHRVPPAVLLSIAVLGNIAGTLTPASSGEVLRATALRSHAQVSGRDGAALVLFERALSLYLMATGTAVAAAWMFLPAWAGVAAAVAALPAVALPVFAAPLLRLVPASNDSGEAPAGLLRRTMRRVADVAGQLRVLFGDARLVLEWGLVTTVIFATTTLQLWLLARSLSHAISPGEMWVGLGASQLAGIASLLPLGLGAADGSLAALLHRMGMTLGQGAVVAILVRATSTIPLLLLALASYLYLLRRAPLEDGSTSRVDAPPPAAAP
jgi:uncharacterized protein (TIRG00374 family)